MANEFQRQSLRRKLIYVGVILALLCVTVALRSEALVGERSLDKQAERLGLREESIGEVDLTGRAVQLMLTGSRGFVICFLWDTAKDKQERHEWNELELLVRSVIKLQPHFITPWLYQSWNLAYNVPGELDRVKDKYFYITRGISLLAQGDRVNRDNPDVRFWVGNYTQSKIGIADEKNTLRALFQMSCIDPAERDPGRFRRVVNGQPVVDLEQFEDFCRKHPMLVRRLHDRLRCRTPDDVVDFLAANQHIPCRYEESRPGGEESAAAYKPLDERFPALPPRQSFDPDEATDDSAVGDDFDNYAAARAWYGYAQDPIDNLGRIPRGMKQSIFESYPARAQAYVGEHREDEGWFDTDGWEIRDWFPRDRSGGRARRAVRVGTERNWAEEAWEKAYAWYVRFGTTKRLDLPPAEVEAMDFAQRYEYENDRDVTNYPRHLNHAKVERLKEAVTAHKLFYQADELRKAGERERALAVYERPEAIPAWRKILLDNPEYRSDLDVQEDTYVVQRKYMSLVRDRRLGVIRDMLRVQDFLTGGAVAAPVAYAWAPAYILPHASFRTPLMGPFDVLTPDKKPLLSAKAIEAALTHYSMARDPERPNAPIAGSDRAPAHAVRQRSIQVGGQPPK